MGDDLPDSIADRPELTDLQQFYYDAFIELNTSRLYSFSSEGPIPWHRIEEYLDRKQVTDLDEREEFKFILRKMDEEYRQFVKDKRAAEKKAEEDKRNKNPRMPPPQARRRFR